MDPVKFKHVDELLKMLAAFTHDNRFLDVMYDEEGGKPKDMCEVLDRVEAKGIAIGEARGIAIGEAKGKHEGEKRMVALMEKLFELGRVDDAQRAVSDQSFRTLLYKEFNIA